MNPNDVLGFLLPRFGDPLQLTFFLVISAMIGATIAGAHRMARPVSWERRWNRGTPDDPTDDLGIEHGSVTDLWHAVATAPEKLAEIMPGMLLVVGLLGTFLGLGLALNNASSILGHSNLADPGAAADSMQNLLGMLQGLGTKFKTSVWGILGFVMLKIWSESTRFDEKRLAWVIGKVKCELEQRKRTEEEVLQARQQALFTQIGGTAQHIVDGFGHQLGTLIRSNESLHLQQLTQLARIEQGGVGIRTELARVQSGIEQGNEAVRTELARVQSGIAQGNETVQSGLALVQAGIEKGNEAVCTELVRVQASTDSMCTSMTGFSKSTQDVVEKMGVAAQGMAAGADKVGSGAAQLVQAVDAFESQFTEVLNNVRQDLSGAINNLSTQASNTLKEGSSQLNEATTKISTALGELSADVKETMSAVDASIKKALKIQERAAEEFILSSKELNENIATTTSLAEKLAKPIEQGLKAVSTATLQTRSMVDAVQNSTASLVDVVAHLRNLPETLSALNRSTADVVQNSTAGLADVLAHLNSLTNALSPLKSMSEEHQTLVDALVPVAETIRVQQAMLELLKELQRDRIHAPPAAIPALGLNPVTDTSAV